MKQQMEVVITNPDRIPVGEATFHRMTRCVCGGDPTKHAKQGETDQAEAGER